VFAPGRTAPDDVAGFGVVDPMGMLLATSLMLAEGLKRRSASRTLERAVGAAASRHAGGDDTRAFTDAVIDLLPQSRTDVEHFDEVWR
jgi:isocitrate/isopropylmalate dehydrogenase